MLFVVVVIFALCWLPYHLYFIYTYYDQQVVRLPFIRDVYLAIYWLAMANSCVNPIIYYYMNVR